MKVKKTISHLIAGLALCSLFLLIQGCATPKTPWYNYFQREPIRVVVMPSGNKTDHPDAPVVFNKACEEALTAKGFKVISADRVVTFASSQGILLNNIAELKASEIGKALNADMVLYSAIDVWESKYVVLNTRVRVAGMSRMVEASTDSLVWHYQWDFQKDSSDGNNNGVLGMLINAAVSAVVNSAVDASALLGAQAGSQTVGSLPYPGMAPADSRPPLPATRPGAP